MIRTYRDLIEAFESYENLNSLDEIANQIDDDIANPTGIYLLSLGRLPENPDMCRPSSSYCPREHLRQVLLSSEFQSKVIAGLLNHFGEYERELYVHIPRCGGTDLRVVLGDVLFPLPKDLALEEWTEKEALLQHLRRFACARKTPPLKFFVCGHFTLGEYINLGFIRACDHVFTVLRHPVDRVLSHVNYIVHAMRQDPKMVRPDTRLWASWLNLANLDNVRWEELPLEILKSPAFKSDFTNLICNCLGDGTFKSAVRNILTSKIEIIFLKDYDAWLAKKWQVVSRRVNAAEKYISYSDLSLSMRLTLLDELVGEDLKLYDFVAREGLGAAPEA